MRRIIIALLAGFFLLTTASPALAQICKTSSHCTKEEVGAFLQDISAKCMNTGDCSLADIMIVVNNAGVYILGIIGSLVLLMYVIGGFFLLTARGNSEQVSKGKTMLIRASIGLVIVFVAFAAIQTIESVLKTGELRRSAKESQVNCQTVPPGTSCGKNMICQNSQCVSLCSIESQALPGNYACINTKGFSAADKDRCTEDLCPGDENNLCCPTTSE